jgi:hypothetical protein
MIGRPFFSRRNERQTFPTTTKSKPPSAHGGLARRGCFAKCCASRSYAFALVAAAATASAQTAGTKPNILVIWGDDVGVHNISAYNHGIMGYKTPNIDRIAKEGVMFTDAYAQQSCTAGRASGVEGERGAQGAGRVRSCPAHEARAQADPADCSRSWRQPGQTKVPSGYFTFPSRIYGVFVFLAISRTSVRQTFIIFVRTRLSAAPNRSNTTSG